MNLGGNADGLIKLYQHDIWLSTATNCTQAIYEGYQQSSSYKILETDVKDGVKEVYKSKFLIIPVEKHKFKPRQLIIPNLFKTKIPHHSYDIVQCLSCKLWIKLTRPCSDTVDYTRVCHPGWCFWHKCIWKYLKYLIPMKTTLLDSIISKVVDLKSATWFKKDFSQVFFSEFCNIFENGSTVEHLLT